MKTSILKCIIAILCPVVMATSCSKDNAILNDNNTALNEFADKKTSGTVCSTCDVSSKTYDLLDQLKTMPLNEGNNVVATLSNGAKMIAQVKKGVIAGWYMQSKSGTIYNPSSATNTQQKMSRNNGLFPIYRICFYLDGLYTCWLVIKI
ncbi:MAG: hypothetical protein QM763_03900 [Agriterribacter sp.]